MSEPKKKTFDKTLPELDGTDLIGVCFLVGALVFALISIAAGQFGATSISLAILAHSFLS